MLIRRINKLYKIASSDLYEKHKKERLTLLNDLTMNSGHDFERLSDKLRDEIREFSDVYIESIENTVKIYKEISESEKRQLFSHYHSIVQNQINSKINVLQDRLRAARIPKNIIESCSNSFRYKVNRFYKIGIEKISLIIDDTYTKDSNEMEIIIPDLNWYLNLSKNNKTSPRCPFASAHKCPRFYESLSLLGEAGSTKINKKEDKKLLKKWKKSILKPLTREQETIIVGPNGNYKHFNNFCPEVSFERFGYFASDLHRYAEEIDNDLAHENLGKINASKNDWRWYWFYVRPQHYSECLLYSLLLNETNKDIKEDIIDLKPNISGIGINFNALWRKIKEMLKKMKL